MVEGLSWTAGMQDPGHATRAKDVTSRRYRSRGVFDQVEWPKNPPENEVLWSRVGYSIGLTERASGLAKVAYGRKKKNAHCRS